MVADVGLGPCPTLLGADECTPGPLSCMLPPPAAADCHVGLKALHDPCLLDCSLVADSSGIPLERRSARSLSTSFKAASRWAIAASFSLRMIFLAFFSATAVFSKCSMYFSLRSRCVLERDQYLTRVGPGQGTNRCACRFNSCLRVVAGLLSGFGPLLLGTCPSYD